jgi:hypothetical protein
MSRKYFVSVAEIWRQCGSFKETWLSAFHNSSRERTYRGTAVVAE